MSKHGGETLGGKNDAQKNETVWIDRYKNDKILQWIEKRRAQLANAEDHPSTTEGLKILDELYARRQKTLEGFSEKREYNNMLKNFTDHAYDEFRDDVDYIREKVKKDPSFTKDDAEKQIAEREAVYRERIDEIGRYNEWLRDKRYRINGPAPKAQPNDIAETPVYFQKEQETSHDYEERMINNENIAVITSLIPIIRADAKTKDNYRDFISKYVVVDDKGRRGVLNGIVDNMKNQTPEEYSDLILEICRRFPRKSNENQEAYEKRMRENYERGDLQFAAAKIMGYPQIDDVDREIKKAEKRMNLDTTTPEERKQLEEWVKARKNLAFTAANIIRMYDNATETKEAKESHRENLAIIRELISTVKADKETKKKYHDFVSSRQGLTNERKKELYDCIKDMKSQTKKEYLDLILEIYKRYPRVIYESNEEYSKRMKENFERGDLQLAAAEALYPIPNDIVKRIERLEGELTKNTLTAKQRKEVEEKLKSLKIETFTGAQLAQMLSNGVGDKEVRDAFQRDLITIRTEKERTLGKNLIRKLGRLANLIAKPNE